MPYRKHHAQFMNESWPGGEGYWLYGFPGILNPLLDGSLHIFWAVIQSLGGEKNCIIYSFVCIFIIIITIISIYFVVLFNCLLSQTMSFPFCPFLLPILLEGKGRDQQAAVWCLVAGCWVKLQQEMTSAASLLMWCALFHQRGCRGRKGHCIEQYSLH